MNKTSIFVPQMIRIILFTTLTMLYACQTGKSTSVLSSQNFAQDIKEQSVQILDVRTPEEYESGHIKHAVNIDINGNDFDKGVSDLYKEVPVYVYCLKGARSHTAANRLKELGFTRVFELDGGINAWLDNQMPVVKTEAPKVYESDTIPFETAIKGSKLVMVDFNATWCGPCRVLQPSIEKLHDERSEDVIVYSIDVDKRRDLAETYEARAIPLILMFKNGKIVHRSEGVVPFETLNNLVDVNK